MALFRFPSFDPNGLQALQRELDRTFGAPLFSFGGGPARSVFPAVNVFDDKHSYVVRIEAPGVPPDAFVIESHGRTLTVSGKREMKMPERGSYHRRERDSGGFSRSLQLPEDADSGSAEASYAHGILTVTVPRREEAKSRQISVKAA